MFFFHVAELLVSSGLDSNVTFSEVFHATLFQPEISYPPSQLYFLLCAWSVFKHIYFTDLICLSACSTPLHCKIYEAIFLKVGSLFDSLISSTLRTRLSIQQALRKQFVERMKLESLVFLI